MLVQRALRVFIALCATTLPMSATHGTAKPQDNEEQARLSRLRSPLPPPQAIPAMRSEIRYKITPDQMRPRPADLTREGKRSKPNKLAELGAAAAAVAACDTTKYASLSGSALAQYIQDAGPDCANTMFVGNATSFAAFTKTKMIEVANATATLARTYTGSDPNQGLEALYLWLRAGYYVAYYNSTNVPWYNPTTDVFDAQVVAATRSAIDALVNSGYFYTNSDANGKVITEAITLMDSSGSNTYYLGVVKEWLSRWNSSYATSWNMRAGVNTIFTVLFRGHWKTDFQTAVASDTTLISRLSAFVDMTWMLNTDAEFMITNATRELTRFLQYKTAPIYGSVSSKAKNILASYPLTHPLYVATAGNVNYYDDCNLYGTCTFEKDLEAAVLGNQFTCSPTYKMRAQSMTSSQFTAACSSLSAQETYFHTTFNTTNKPVGSDNNTSLEVAVFNSSNDYQQYAGVIFGIDTNNGGMYLEGDPATPGNQARFICYRAEWAPSFSIWNLEHECVHYLDGRYTMKGSFGDYRVDTHKTVWWIEGVAEYISKKNCNEDAINAARSKAYSLSTIFSNTYSSGQDRVYTWGYLAVRFMMERHPSEITTLRNYFNTGDYAGYLTWINGRLSTYNSEFSTWCDTVQSSCTTSDQPPTVAWTSPASGATVNGTLTLAASATDDVGVADVTFAVDGVPLSIDATSPYSASWDTTKATNGSHTLTATAKDSAGQTKSASVTVTVNNTDTPPTVQITAPANGTTVSSNVTLTAIAADDKGVASVAFLVNGTPLATDTTAPYSASWNTTTVANGTHTLTATATDTAGKTTSTTVTVTVNNSTPYTPLANGVGLTVSGAKDTQNVFYIDVPSGATNLVMALSGGTGDADLHTRFGAIPTLTSYDCRPYLSGNNESCTVASPSAGRYYLMLHGYTAYSGATLKATFTASQALAVNLTAPTSGSTVSGTTTLAATTTGSGISKVEFLVDGTVVGTDTTSPYSFAWNSTQVGNGAHSLTARATNSAGQTATSPALSVTVNNVTPCVAIPSNQLTVGTLHCVPAGTGTRSYWFRVPQGATSMTVSTSGGTGNGDVYVSPTTWASTSNYSKKSTNAGNVETVTDVIPAGVTYFYVSVVGNPSGMSLKVTTR